MGWKEFEIECTNYLNNTFGNGSIIFTGTGFSDSSSSDIKVLINGNNKFSIEIKEKNAQCGQFVLLPIKEKKEFEYSKLNKYPSNQESKAMVTYMNGSYDTFVNAGTKGEPLNLDTTIFYKWIIDYYKSKKVWFVITENNGKKIIFPIEKFETFFQVSAQYRLKKSGSANPSSANEKEIRVALDNPEAKIRFVNKKAYVDHLSDIDGMKISGGEYTYQFKRTNANTYNIRRLSNTGNSNVIFSISLKSHATQDANDLELFKNSLK